MRKLIFLSMLIWFPTAIFFLTPTVVIAAPASSDCVTTASGNWNDPATWNGCGGLAPGVTDNVFVQSGHTVSLTQDEAVQDLHVSTGTTTNSVDGVVAIGVHQLDLYGKLRTYKADLNDVPGESNSLPGAASIKIQPGAGTLRVAGNTRILTYSGEWGAPSSGSPEMVSILIDLNAGATITAETSIKASMWTLANGTLNMGANRIAVDTGTAGEGDITVAAGGTLISAASGSSSPVFHRSSTNPGGALTVDGSLVLEGASPCIYMESIQFNGAISYTRSGSQNLVSAGSSSGATPALYQNLVLANSGTKSLSTDTTVLGTLFRSGTAELNPDVWTLSYGPNAGVAYAGSAAQTTGPELSATSIPNLTVDNSGGVQLGQNLEVTSALALTTGDLHAGAYMLTLDAAATCTGPGDVTGRVHRTGLTDGVPFCFGHPDVQIGLVAGSTAPTAVDVELHKGVAPFAGAVTRAYTITAPGFAGTATLRLHYTDAELNGNPAGDLALWRWDGTRWLLQGKSSAGAGYVEQIGITAFSPWALAAQGETTAATVAAFTASAVDDGTLLRWQTDGGSELLGFLLLRSRAPGITPRQITAEVIPVQEPDGTTGAIYTFVDNDVNTPAYYWLELIELDGSRSLIGPVTPDGTRWYLPAAFGR